jgi:uncharacterized SAM-binding protein YcdF (DUF218 family)
MERLVGTIKKISALALLALVPIILSEPVSVTLGQMLQERFPSDPAIPAELCGMIILGGDLEYHAAGPTSYVMRSARVATAIPLAKKFRNVRIVLSGGYKEAEDGRNMLVAAGISPSSIVAEMKSKTTWENAVFTRRLIGGDCRGPWILITSSVHMPRAIGAFRQAGLEVIGVPAGREPPEVLGRRSFREALALLYYHITGRSNALLPSPDR